MKRVVIAQCGLPQTGAVNRGNAMTKQSRVFIFWIAASYLTILLAMTTFCYNTYMNNPEILAPAGSYDAFLAAVSAGADAVYMGLESFSARAKASNFTAGEFYNLTQYAHSNGVKVYGAFNTLVKQHELKDAIKALNIMEAAGADAVIVQDLGIANIVKKYFPSLKLHASTQMAIHNSYGVLQAQELGFQRVVLARELSLSEIQTIKQKTDAELEIFVHGALCFGVSGMCLMSSFIGGASGNRGLCAQPCRRLWSLKDKKGFYLSPKDLDLSAHIKELKQSGITSLKIEGRMKNAQYVYKTVKAYKLLLENENSLEARKLLLSDFARTKTTFNFIKKSDDIFEPQKSKQIGQYLGKISYDNGKITIQTTSKINQNDTLKAADAKNDIYYKVNIRHCEERESATRQSRIAYEIQTDSPNLKMGMDLYKTADGVFEEKIKNITKDIEVSKEKFVLKSPVICHTDANRYPFSKNLDSGFRRNDKMEELLIKFDDIRWADLTADSRSAAGSCASSQKISGMTNVFVLNKENLKNSDLLEQFDCFELPAFISETDLPAYQETINKLKNKSFFLNNIGHFQFFGRHSERVGSPRSEESSFSTKQLDPSATPQDDFKRQKMSLHTSPFLYVLNSFAAETLFKAGAKMFSFSYEDDMKNIQALAKENLAGKGIFYLSGFPALAISKMSPCKDLGSDEILSSQKDNFKVLRKNDGLVVLPQYPITLFNKKQQLVKLGINKFLIDLSFIKPNKAYLEAVLNAYNGKTQLKNDIEFNFERGLK